MKKNKPELLSPAGDWSSLMAAVEGGADSVYFGVKGMNMRHLASNFDLLELKKVMKYLKGNKKKGYLTLNTIIMNDDLKKASQILKEVKKVNVDGVILWDMAVFSLARELKLRIHVSTQASISNLEALKQYSRLGAKRIVLARECTLNDIKKIINVIKKEKIKCEVEAFIHGAMCVSISGRCFLSQYSFGKSANKGQCIQPCRRKYYIKDVEQETDYIVGEDYLLSPKDLCTIDFIDELIKIGIDSFKIEGRIRSPEYIKVVTSVYRKAIDLYFEKKLTKKLKTEMKEELKTVYNRGFSSGFYFGQPVDSKSETLENTYEKKFLGEVTRFFKKISVAEIKLRNGNLNKSDQLLFIGKTTSAKQSKIEEIQLNNKFVNRAFKGQIVGVKLPFIVKPKDKVFHWNKKM